MSCRLGEMLFERVENRRVVAFELDLGDPSYIPTGAEEVGLKALLTADLKFPSSEGRHLR